MPTIQNKTSPNAVNGLVMADEQTGKKLNNKELSPDDFITLFLTQLKNQNPMHPTDSSALLQQMSEISQISASKDMAKSMQNLEASMKQTMGSTQVFGASQLIGKKVQVKSDFGKLDKTDGLMGSVGLPGPATKVIVTIKDNVTGKEVKKIDLGPCQSAQGGLMDFKWDGKDADDKLCDPGVYRISAVATFQGKELPMPTAGAFKVNSVGLMKSGSVVINVDEMGGKEMKDILKIL